MKTELIRNTTAQLPDRTVEPGELIENVQICPVGDFPHGDSQQHCTLEALQNVVADWKRRGSKEILVDFEHRSEETDDTSAAAWVSNVRVDPERGLVGDFKMTDSGAEAISNRRLRFLSVSWLVNKQSHEPIRISTIALTNKPNIPVEPVLNKEGKVEEIENVTDENGLSHGEDGRFDGGNGSASGKGGRSKEELKGMMSKMMKREAVSVSAGGNAQAKDRIHFTVRGKQYYVGTDSEHLVKQFEEAGLLKRIKNKEGENMDKIKEALGLAPEATEEDVLNAINAMVKANKDAKQAALEKEAEDFAEKNSKKCNKEVLKAQYIANKEVAKALVEGIPETTAPTAQKMLNKGGAAKPVTDQHEVEQLRNKAIGEYRAAHPGCTFTTAWGACRKENPELFQ